MKKPIIITLHLEDYLDKAFKTIPSNSIIHKGRCGIGGTTLEIKAKRCSIIVVPTLGIITDKCKSHPELFAVKGKVAVDKIAQYLTSKVKYKKIIVTPDSFWNIIEAAGNEQGSKELFQNFFLLMDESHSAITEAWRPKILNPFKYFWKFTNKSLISATSFEFSDTRFQTLQRYYIKFHEPIIGTILLRNTNDISGCIDFYIKNRLEDSKLCVFCNSVLEGAEIIRRNNLNSSIAHIYCAEKEENFDKLPEHLMAFQQQPVTGNYAEVNFFTSKYFEGFDLYEPNATIILVTDIKKPHTKVGITNKGVQALGRARWPTQQLIHITNNRNIQEMKPLSQFKKEYELHTKMLITGYNAYINECNLAQIEPVENAAKPIERFTDIDASTKIATLEDTKLDQVLNELACNEQFNNIDAIAQAWEQSLFEVVQIPFFDTKAKRYISKADKLREQIGFINELMVNKAWYVKGEASRILAKIQVESPFAVEAYFNLGMKQLEELEYNQKAIEHALIAKHNSNAELKLLAYLDSKLILGNRYLIGELVQILQYGYNLFQIRNEKTGKIKIAEAVQLGGPGRYKLKDCKQNVRGELKNGFLIVEKHFNVTIAA